ncbi:MAG: hypothetical protein WCI55_08225 [Armatimonadota bacterium]
MIWLVVVIIVAATVYGYLVFPKKPKYLAHAEYWVYSKAVELPSTEKLMIRLVGSNPYIQQGQNPIGGAEGLVLSDVRLKIALVLQKKNPKLFEGRLLPEAIADHHEFVNDVGSFNSIVKLQYVSTTKLKDKRHIQFLMHAADAAAEIAGAGWILDKITGTLRTKQEQAEILQNNFNVTKLEYNVVLKANEDNTFSSYGLMKAGIPDFDTHIVSSDQVQLVREILNKYMALSWERGEPFPDPIKEYDDDFFIIQKPTKSGRSMMRIVRKQLVP